MLFLQESNARFNRNVNRVLKAVDWPDAKKVKRPHSHRQHHEHQHEDLPQSSSSHQAGPSSSPHPETGVSLAAKLPLYASWGLLPRRALNYPRYLQLMVMFGGNLYIDPCSLIMILA